jgi:hypothetical protein
MIGNAPECARLIPGKGKKLSNEKSHPFDQKIPWPDDHKGTVRKL